ncbi:MAG: hypothetical protein ACQETM_10150, partial [Bacteroidota bacterium]
IEKEVPGVLIEVKVEEGIRLGDLNEQDSYSYDLAWIFVGANNYRELSRKYLLCLEKLRFEFKPVDGIPPGIFVENIQA